MVSEQAIAFATNGGNAAVASYQFRLFGMIDGLKRWALNLTRVIFNMRDMQFKAYIIYCVSGNDCYNNPSCIVHCLAGSLFQTAIPTVVASTV